MWAYAAGAPDAARLSRVELARSNRYGLRPPQPIRLVWRIPAHTPIRIKPLGELARALRAHEHDLPALELQRLGVVARQLYDSPTNEFVMTFVGDAIRFDGMLVRPHDLEVSLEADVGSHEAQIERVVHLGFDVRAELVGDHGTPFVVQLTRDDAETLELERGQIVFVRVKRARELA